jgi:hypothetical protein
LVNPRTARRLVTASYTSMIVHLRLLALEPEFLNPLEWARTELKLATCEAPLSRFA